MMAKIKRCFLIFAHLSLSKGRFPAPSLQHIRKNALTEFCHHLTVRHSLPFWLGRSLALPFCFGSSENAHSNRLAAFLTNCQSLFVTRYSPFVAVFGSAGASPSHFALAHQKMLIPIALLLFDQLPIAIRHSLLAIRCRFRLGRSLALPISPCPLSLAPN